MVFLYRQGDEGNLHAAIHQLTVGLVGDDVDGVAVLGALALQQSSQTLQRLLGVHNAGGLLGELMMMPWVFLVMRFSTSSRWIWNALVSAGTTTSLPPLALTKGRYSGKKGRQP